MASESWDIKDLGHRYTVSFFKSQYGDDPGFIMASPERANSELLYYNTAGSNILTEATICSSLMIAYMEAQGIPYHPGKLRNNCFTNLRSHLKKSAGTALRTADIVDTYFRFVDEA